jgi:glutamyl-tRNA(Gln) amidotransferase subunit D
MNVYYTGRDLLALGVLPLEDMIPETALVKMMWAFGQTADAKGVSELMLSNIAGEISSRRTRTAGEM